MDIHRDDATIGDGGIEAVSHGTDHGRGEEYATYLVDLVACGTRKIPFLTEPVPLDFHLKTALDDRITGELAECTLRELENLFIGRSAWMTRNSLVTKDVRELLRYILLAKAPGCIISIAAESMMEGHRPL